MKAHIQQTINDVESKIAALQNLVACLLALDQEGIPGVPAMAPPTRPAHHTSPNVRASNGSTHTKKHRRSDAADRNAAACLTLPEPFTGIQLAKVTGLTKNGASSQIKRWVEAGLIMKVDYGKYKCSANFPGKAVNPRSITPASHKPIPRSDLEKQLNDALKHRDHARAQGNDTVVEIFQADIDRLTKQLT